MCSSCLGNFHSSYNGRTFCTVLMRCTFLFYQVIKQVCYCTVISVNRPFIIRCISGKRAFYMLHVRYSCGHCVTTTLQTTIMRPSSSRSEFCHCIINQILHVFVRFPSVIYPINGLDKIILVFGQIGLGNHKLCRSTSLRL